MEEEIKEMEKRIYISLKLMNDSLKIAYDYYKYLATLITGSLFIIVILHEKVFHNPEKVWIEIISISALVISLVLLLGVLGTIRDYFAIPFSAHTAFSSNESIEKSMEKFIDISKQVKSMGKTQKILIPATHYTFILGLIALAIFVSFNLLK